MGGMGDLVSVIVPVFGVEQHLRRCLDSLVGQSHEDLEIILVDDGSPDQSGAICDDYARSDPRVRVIHQDNTGPSGARNAGLDVASGRFLTFVDSDDWVHRDLVAHLLEMVDETGADIAGCRLRRVATQEGPPSAPSDSSVRSLTAREALGLYAGPLASTMTSPCAKLFRAGLFEQLRFPPGRLYEDEFTTYRAVARADTVALSSAELYYYAVRPESTTQRVQDVRQRLDRVAALLERGDYFQSIGLDEASGVSFQKAFLLLRQVRGDARRSGDGELERRMGAQLRAVAKRVAGASLPTSFRAFAVAYAAVPAPVDAVLRAYRAGQSLAGRVRRVPTGPGPLARTPARTATAQGVEVIVVAYGDPASLRRALEPVSALEVTVVDNSSMPEIAEVCGELGCRYLDAGANVGFAAGVNVGLVARSDPTCDVLLLNPDAVVSEEQVRRLQAALHSAPDIASVGPRQVDAHGKPTRVSWPFPSPLGTWLEALGLWRLRRQSPTYVIGSILLLRAEAIRDVGRFDERFFLYAEEADWALRAHRKGWRHGVVDDVVAMHVGGGMSSDEAKRAAHFHGSQERFMRKHYGALGWQAARTGQVLGDSLRGWLRGAAGQPSRTRAALYRRGPAMVESEHRGATGSETASESASGRSRPV